MASKKKKKEIPSVFEVLDRRRNEQIAQMSNGNASTNEYLNKKLAPSSKEQIASGTMKAGNVRNASYGNNNAGYVARQIIAPMPNASSNKPATTSNELLNKITMQNQENLKKQQEQNKMTSQEEALLQQVNKEKSKLGILSKEEINALNKQALSNDKLYSQTIDGKKNNLKIDKKEGETYLQAVKRITKENEKKEIEYNKTSKAAQELSKIQGKKLGYLSKKTGAGALKGITGIGQASLTEQAKGVKQGSEDKSILNIIKNLHNSNPVNAGTSSLIDALINLSKKDDRKPVKKAVDFLIDLADAPMKAANATTQLEGMVAPKDTYKKILKANDTISKPSQKLDEKLNKEGQKYSKTTRTAGEILDVVGNMIPSMAVTAVTKNPDIGLATMGLGAKGTSTMEALNNGESLDRATKIGSLKGEIEVGTELLTGGLKMFGKGTLDDIGEKIVGRATNKVATKGFTKTAKVVNGTLNIIKDLGGEIGEETISDVLNTVIDKNTYNPDAKYSFDDFKHTAGITAASTLVLNILTHGAAKKVNKVNISDKNMESAIANAEGRLNVQFTEEDRKQINDVVKTQLSKNSLSQNEQRVLDNIVENRVNELKSKQDKVTKKDINKIKREARQDLEKGYIEVNDIERALSNEEWVTHDNAVKQKEKLENQLKELQNKKMSDMTVEEYNDANSKISSLKEQIDAIDTDATRGELYSAMNGKITDNDTLLQNVYSNEMELGKNYENETVDLHNLDSKKTQAQLSKLNKYFKISNEQYNQIKNKTFVNMKKTSDVKFQSTDKVMKSFDGGGARTFDTIRAISDDIKEVGIDKPIYISKETNKIYDGNHRLFVAKQMGLDSVPVKYIESSNDIDIKDNNWYDRLEKRISDYNEGKEGRITQTNGTIQDERFNENRSNEIVKERGRYSEDNRLHKETKYKNQRLSTETVYGNDSSLGQGINQENSSSSFSNGIKKQRVNGQWLSLPNSNNSLSDNDIPQNEQKVNNGISINSNMQTVEKDTQKAVKKAIAPLNEEVKALRKEISDLKENRETQKQEKLYEDIDKDGVIKAEIKYDKKFSDKSIDQLQQIKQKLNHTIENPFKANTKELNDARLQYAELTNEFSRRGLNIKDTIVEDATRLMEHKAQKKTKSKKTKTTRTPLDFGTLDEIENRVKSKQNGEVIEALNQMDSETENKSIEAQKKIKSKNESKLKKAKTYAQYLATNRNVEIDNYAKETGNHNIQVLADHINNVQGEITTNINNAQTDNKGNTIGKGIAQIFSQADKAGLSEGFNDYLFHLSNVERHKWGKGSQIPMNDSLALIDEYEKTYPEMKSWAKEVNQYNKNLLYKQADAGLITKELADGLSKRYEFYVPFMENLDGEYTPDSTNQIKTRSTVKSARGGANRNLLDFEEAMIKQTQSAISQIRKNQLYQEIVKTKENSTTDFDTNTNPDIQDNGLFNDNGKYYLTAYVDGKATQVEIDKSLYHGLSQNGNRIIRQVEQKLAPITKPLQAIGNIRRNILTTWSPTFLITNPLKDLQDAPLNSKYAKDFSKNVPKAFKEMFTGKGEHLESFLNMYGQANLRGDYNLDSGLSDITKLVDKKTNSEASNKGIGVSKKLLKKIPQINEMIEMAPRYAEYLASLENGCSQMEALYNAREVTTNFGRGGIVTKALNRNGFTFLNASVQGMSKLVRNFSGENGGRAVVGCIAKATTLGIAPALLNALLFGDDDDYEVIPDYIKDNYYLIKTSDNDFIRIPKGRMMSIFGSAARRTLEGVQGREKPFEGYLSNAYNQVGVQNPSESNIFAPLIQAKNNKTWYGTDLVPKRLQTNKKDGTKIPAKDQYDASTDKMSIWLGKKLNISPYKINYVIDQYSGGIGDMVLPTMTEEAQSKSDSVIGKMIAPLKDKFSADSTTDNKYVTNFYSKLEELGEKKNATGSKKDEMSYNYMQNISYEMGALYKEMREVQANKKLADSKKYAKVQNIKAEINKLAEEGMKGYKDVETYNNYARVGNRELYKYQSKNGETGWSDSNGKYADDINNLGLSIKEKDEYYTTKIKLSDVASKFKENEGSEKYRAVLNTIRNSKLTSDAKYELYNSWYGKNDETSSIVQDLGISANDYLKFKTADLTSDKNKNGYAIRGSKANKITKYLNKTNLDTGQKAVLYRLAFSYKGSYNSSKYSNAYNQEIVNYINNSNLTYDESENALKKLGFKVSKDGTIKW